MLSDNGTNFVEILHELQDAMRNWKHNQTNTFMLQKGIKWTFNLVHT